jgi:hypothetical protein
MMKIIERHVQKLGSNQWQAYQEREQKFAAIEERAGSYPRKRYCGTMIGNDLGTIVWEREWESMAAMEAAYEGLRAAPDFQDAARMPGIESERIELYVLFDLPNR